MRKSNLDFSLGLLLGVAFIAGILFQRSFGKKKSSKSKVKTDQLTEKEHSTANYTGYLDFITTNVRKILSRFSAPKAGEPVKKSIIPEKWLYLIGGVLMLMAGSMFGFIPAVQLAFVFAGIFLIIIATRGTAVAKKEEAK